MTRAFYATSPIYNVNGEPQHVIGKDILEPQVLVHRQPDRLQHDRPEDRTKGGPLFTRIGLPEAEPAESTSPEYKG